MNCFCKDYLGSYLETCCMFSRISVCGLPLWPHLCRTLYPHHSHPDSLPCQHGLLSAAPPVPQLLLDHTCLCCQLLVIRGYRCCSPVKFTRWRTKQRILDRLICPCGVSAKYHLSSLFLLFLSSPHFLLLLSQSLDCSVDSSSYKQKDFKSFLFTHYFSLLSLGRAPQVPKKLKQIETREDTIRTAIIFQQQFCIFIRFNRSQRRFCQI